MSVLKKLRPTKAEPVDEDWILPDSPTSAATAPDPRTPVTSDPPLTAERAAAVRFQIAKPGYEFAQVEAFVQQTQAALHILEQGLYQRDVSLHEARTDIQDLTEKVATLQATIEVFRANGDPEVSADGSYVTEEQWTQLAADRESFKQQTEQLHDENRALLAELQQARADLAAAIPVAAVAGCEHDTELTELAALRGETETLRAAMLVEQQRAGELANDLAAARTELDAVTVEPAQETQEESQELVAMRQELANITTERDEALQEIQELRDYIDGALTQWMQDMAQTPDADVEVEHEQPDGEDSLPTEGARKRAPLHDAPELA